MCCACGPSERLDPPSICFVCVFVCRKLSPHLGAGSQVFPLLMLFHCVILHTMSTCKSLQLLCIYVCQNSVGSVYINGYAGLKRTLCLP